MEDTGLNPIESIKDEITNRPLTAVASVVGAFTAMQIADRMGKKEWYWQLGASILGVMIASTASDVLIYNRYSKK